MRILQNSRVVVRSRLFLGTIADVFKHPTPPALYCAVLADLGLRLRLPERVQETDFADETAVHWIWNIFVLKRSQLLAF